MRSTGRERPDIGRLVAPTLPKAIQNSQSWEVFGLSDLHPISGCENVDRKADVVYVHGLGGDAFATWRYGKGDETSWPHWLGQEFPEVGVWSLGYAAALTKWARLFGWLSSRWRDAGHAMPLPDRAKQVLDLLVQHGLGQRPLLFICHSLGGLVVKHVLRASSDAVDPSARGTVFNSTRAVLFLATPHTGAPLATLLKSFRVAFPTIAVQDLAAHDAHLRELFDWYRNHVLSPGVETRTYFESRGVGGALTIVNPTSAHPGVGEDPIALDEDHLSIAKPRDPGAQVCAAARELLRSYVLTSLQSTSSESARIASTAAIKKIFSDETGRTLHRSLDYVRLPVINEHINRAEVASVVSITEAQRGALVVGEAGTGKSGIATLTAVEMQNRQIPVLYLDSRRVAHIYSIAQLGQYLGLHEDLPSAVRHLGQAEGCAVIVDQLDTIGTLPAARVLAEFLTEIVGHDGVRAIGVCRDWDVKERDELRELRGSSFQAVVSEPLPEDTVRSLLQRVNINQPNPDLVELARNLLNLAIVLEVSSVDPEADLENIHDQLGLWDRYRYSIQQREGTSSQQGKAVVGAAVSLAKASLVSGTRIFPLSLPPFSEEERLVSRGVLIADEGERYRFRHEQLHDYFYAWDASERRGLMPKQVLAEIGEAASRNVLRIMMQIYHDRMPLTEHKLSREAEFLKEVLGL